MIKEIEEAIVIVMLFIIITFIVVYTIIGIGIATIVGIPFVIEGAIKGNKNVYCKK